MKRGLILVGILLLPSLALGSPIEPGFDLFATYRNTPLRIAINGGTFIDFGPDGGPKVLLKGNFDPLYMSERLGITDTIVQRLEGIYPFRPPHDVGTIEIQLVALSLKSEEPFDIGFLPGFSPGTMADLYVTVNARGEEIPCLYQPDTLQPSMGMMTIRHEDNNGGTFNSTLTVYSDLIFVEPNESFYDSENWLHHMPAEPIFLKSTDGEWSHYPIPDQPDYHNDEYPAGNFYPQNIYHTGPHQVIPTGGNIDPPGCQYTTQVADEFGSPSTSDPSYLQELTKLKSIFPITLNKKILFPSRFSTSLLTPRQRKKDDLIPKWDATSQAFLTTLKENLASVNFSKVIVEMNEDLSRLEIPIITAADDTPQAWYSALVTKPIEIRSKEKPPTGLLVKDNGIVYFVFTGNDQQYYESALLPALDSTLADAITEAVPTAIIEQSLAGEITFTLDNQVRRVTMDYIVTAIDSNSSQLLVDLIDVNEDQKMDYILSAQGKQQIAFGQ